MLITSELLARHGVKAVFSDRDGGVSPVPYDSLNLGSGLGDQDSNVKKNLSLLCRAAEVVVPHQALQVHGNRVLHCSGRGVVHEDEADILVASELNVSLAVRTADCVPLLLADTKAGVVAAAHAGWKGTVQKVAEVAVAQMCLLGAKAESIVVVIGPSIHRCCFEVSEDVAEQIRDASSEGVTSTVSGKVFSDLPMANMEQLLRVGVKRENIEIIPYCTSCSLAPSYFSYRRDHGLTGRQLSIVMLS